MSKNCLHCVRNPRTGADLLCDDCRTAKFLNACVENWRPRKAVTSEDICAFKFAIEKTIKDCRPAAQQINIQVQEKWTNETPKMEGIYEFKCGETQGEPELIKIYSDGAELWVKSDIGTNLLQRWHDNLQNPEYKFITAL